MFLKGNIHKGVCLVVFSFLGIGCYGMVLGQDALGPSVLTMGRATDDVVKEQKRLDPIIHYLAARLKDMGIQQGKTVLAGDNQNSTLISLVRNKKIDLVIESVFSSALLKIKTEAIPLTLVWRQGAGEYQSYIFVRNDSGINNLEDLKGKRIAYEDNGSTSSYFLPKFSLQQQGIEQVELFNFESTVPLGKVGYVFAGSEFNISGWVFFKKVSAGALSELDWHEPEENPTNFRKTFKIIHKTPKVSRLLLLARKGLGNKLMSRIRVELLQMDQTESGKKALQQSTYKINKFAPLSDHHHSTLEEIVRLHKEGFR